LYVLHNILSIQSPAIILEELTSKFEISFVLDQCTELSCTIALYQMDVWIVFEKLFDLLCPQWPEIVKMQIVDIGFCQNVLDNRKCAPPPDKGYICVFVGSKMSRSWD